MPPSHPPAAGRLAGAPVALLAVAVTVPAAVVAGYLPAGYATNRLLQPLLFLAVGLLLLTFAAGQAAMARRLPHPGPLYSTVARGLGRPLGLGAAGLAVFSYTALQLALYGLAGTFAAPLLASWPGIEVPWWVVAFGCWLVVAGCGLLRPSMAAWLIAVLVLGEIVVIVGYGAANLLHPSAAGLSWPAPAAVSRPALGLLLAATALSFVGFETAAGQNEGTRHPRRAMYLGIVLIAVLAASASWAMTAATGPGRIEELAGARGPELMFDLAAQRLAPWAVTLGRVTLITGVLAGLLALHRVVGRYLLALGRERVLPPLAPWAVSLTQTVVIGAVLGGYAYAGAGLGRGPAVAGGLGILVLLATSSLAALVFLNRNPNGEGIPQRLLAPGIAAVGLGVLGYLVAPALPVVVASGAVVLLGIGYALVLRRRAPVVYAGLGLGGAAVVVTPVAPVLPRQRMPGAHRPERVNREELTG